MTLEEILLHLLTTAAPAELPALIADRIYFGRLDNGCEYPALRITGVSKPAGERNSTGQQHTTKRATYQIDVYANKYLEAATIAGLITSHLDGYQSTHQTTVIQLIEADDINPDFLESSEKHRHSIDISILHRSK